MLDKFRAWNGEKMFFSSDEIANYFILAITNKYWVSVMPFIGVLDVCGTEIYLNDIIELADGSRGVVKFKNGYFYHTAETDIMGMRYWYKVIGNIFENPELNNI